VAAAIAQTVDAVLNNSGHILTPTFTTVAANDLLLFCVAYGSAIAPQTPDPSVIPLYTATTSDGMLVQFYTCVPKSPYSQVAYTFTWGVSFAGKAEIVAVRISGVRSSVSGYDVIGPGTTAFAGPVVPTKSTSVCVSFIANYNNTAATTYSSLSSPWVAGNVSSQTKFGINSFNSPTPSTGNTQLTATASQTTGMVGITVSGDLAYQTIQGNMNGQSLNMDKFECFSGWTGWQGN
jgi:hypothetical protein